MAKKPKANWSSFTKAELVQACCTLEAQKAKLQKRIMALERAQDTLTGHLAGAVDELENVALPHGGPYTVMTIDRAKLPGIGPCKPLYDEDLPPAFPWEPK